MAKPPQLPIELVIDTLNTLEIRATYGAVAHVIGDVEPRSVGAVLQQVGGRGQRNSWVVNGDNGLPTGYSGDQLHPRLTQSAHVIDSEDELRARIAEYVVGESTQPATGWPTA